MVNWLPGAGSKFKIVSRIIAPCILMPCLKRGTINDVTKCWLPRQPRSSASKTAKMIEKSGLKQSRFFLAKILAVSSRAMTPEPLSLNPGVDAKESQCAPITRGLSRGVPQWRPEKVGLNILTYCWLQITGQFKKWNWVESAKEVTPSTNEINIVKNILRFDRLLWSLTFLQL